MSALKVMVVVSRKPGISREEFVRHWRELHPAFVRALPGVRGYRQNLAIEHRTEWPFDGIAELRFDSLKDIAVAFDGEAAKALFEHEHEFIGKMEWSIVEEAEIEL
jgi:uncharacterized protein (TIGR02118 family)